MTTAARFLCLFSATLACASIMFLGPSPVLAQPSGAHADNFLYRVMAGDTLIDLAQRFTDTPSNWTTLQKLNQVQDPTLLGIGLLLRIPFALIPEVPSQARVSHVSGDVTVRQNPVMLGTSIVEGDILTTGPQGFATLVLEDNSILSIPAASSMAVDRLRVFQGARLIDTIFQLSRGELESRVAPQETGVGRFEIRTPVSITGVRGTNLRVRTSDQGAQSEVLAGTARLSSSRSQDATLNRGQGAGVGAHGKLLPVRALLPAPVLGSPERGDGGWRTQFDSVPGARAYLVRVSSDPAGTKLVSSTHFDTSPITFKAPGAGTFYVRVRAIDEDGIMGEDAVLPFLGRAVLAISDGSPVVSGDGQAIVLTDY